MSLLVQYCFVCCLIFVVLGFFCGGWGLFLFGVVLFFSFLWGFCLFLFCFYFRVAFKSFNYEKDNFLFHPSWFMIAVALIYSLQVPTLLLSLCAFLLIYPTLDFPLLVPHPQIPSVLFPEQSLCPQSPH